MAEYFKKAILLLLTQECYKEYFEKYNFLHGKVMFIFFFFILQSVISNVNFFRRMFKGNNKQRLRPWNHCWISDRYVA